MKKERVIGIVLATVNVILIAACIVLYLGMDRVEPRFEFQTVNMVYREGMELSGFLEGINAYDDEDGDITDHIVVEKLIENRAENSVVVFYAVSDRAGNVAKCSREFAAVFVEDTENGNVQDRMSGYEGEVQEGWLMQSGFWADLEGGKKEAGEGGNLDAEASGSEEKDGEYADGISEKESETEENGEGEREAIPEDGMAAENEDNQAEESVAEGRNAGEASETSGQEAEEREGRDERAGASADRANQDTGEEDSTEGSSAPPVLTLQVSEVRTRIGVAPAWVEVIGTLSDDKDGYETLFRNLEVSKYDINQAGAYQVTVSTRDSDGNRSQAVPLTIIVK